MKFNKIHSPVYETLFVILNVVFPKRTITEIN